MMIKNILLMSALLMFNTLYGENLQEGSWGVEINPLSLTSLDSEDSDRLFSGMVSYFDPTHSTEIGLSLGYQKNFYADNTYESEALNLTLHYRKFVSKRTIGFYYGGFVSYTNLDGQLENEIRYATVDKFGLGWEIGARVMKTDSDWSFYWGPALRIGRYFGKDNNIFQDNSSLGMSLYDRKTFIDVDFMRLGLRF